MGAWCRGLMCHVSGEWPHVCALLRLDALDPSTGPVKVYQVAPQSPPQSNHSSVEHRSSTLESSSQLLTASRALVGPASCPHAPLFFHDSNVRRFLACHVLPEDVCNPRGRGAAGEVWRVEHPAPEGAAPSPGAPPFPTTTLHPPPRAAPGAGGAGGGHPPRVPPLGALLQLRPPLPGGRVFQVSSPPPTSPPPKPHLLPPPRHHHNHRCTRADHIQPSCLPPPCSEFPPSSLCVAGGYGKDSFGKDGRSGIVSRVGCLR